MRTAAVVIGLSLLLLFSSFTLITTDSSADSLSIDLLYDDGSEIPEDEPIIKKTLVFITYTDESGTRYLLEAGTELTTVNCYLRITSEAGTFKVTSLIPDLEEGTPLRESGLLIRLTDEEVTFESRLNEGDGFTGEFKDGNAPAILQPGVLYKVDIFTETQIEGDSIAVPTPDFTIRFEANLVDAHKVVFMDGETEFTTKVVADGGTIPELPVPPERSGYIFDGWFDAQGKQLTTSTQINEDLTVFSRWSEEPGPDPPGPDPPGPDPPEPEDYEEHTVEVIENEDGSTTTIKTDIIERVDGSSDV